MYPWVFPVRSRWLDGWTRLWDLRCRFFSLIRVFLCLFVIFYCFHFSAYRILCPPSVVYIALDRGVLVRVSCTVMLAR